MTSADLVERVRDRLRTVIEPELHRDLVTLDMVRDLRIDGSTAAMRIVLTTPACPMKDRILSDIEGAIVGRVEGVDAVSVQWDSDVTSRRGVPGRQEIPGVRNVIAISAGKGGVGKSTVSVNVALALHATGARVGIVDADVHGPNIPIMLGIQHLKPGAAGEKMAPISAYGITAISIGNVVAPDQAVMWRGPMASSAMRQLVNDVVWGELDYLIVDLPPGTGDAQLTLAQNFPMTGAVVVTTPQDVSVADVARGITMFRTLKVPILGVVENMSGFVCAHCGERTDIFGQGGGRELAERFAIPFLGAIPLDPRIRMGGGDGQPIMAAAPDSPLGTVFREVASHIAAEVSKENFRASAGPVLPSGPRIPLS